MRNPGRTDCEQKSSFFVPKAYTIRREDENGDRKKHIKNEENHKVFNLNSPRKIKI